MASNSSKKSQDLQSYLKSFKIEDIDDSAICELDEYKNNYEGQTVTTLETAAVDEAAKAVMRIRDDNTNVVVAEVGSYFVDQEGNYYCQKSENCIEQIDRKPPAGKTIIAIKVPSTPKEKPVVAADDCKKTKTPAKANNDENGSVEYVFMLQTNEEEEGELEESDSEFLPEDKHNVIASKMIKNKNKVMRVRLRKNAASKFEANGIVYACNYCDYATYKRHLLASHLRGHSDDRPFKCSVCERGFKTKGTLINHVNAHLGNKPHACKHCSMAFTTGGDLMRHTRYKHTGEKPHSCTECDYSSVEVSKVRRHMRCHTGERPYQCPHCTYASPDTFKLKRHLRTHTGEKPYECDICHSRFTQSNSLKSHRLIHSVGEKPVFQCTYCPTTCGRKTDLRAHILNLHTSDKPIPCKRCGQDFPDRYSYKVHFKTHEGEKSYRCEICPYAATAQRQLIAHMMVHTDEKPFKCKLCEASFRQTALLKRHLNLYHTKDYKAPEPKEKLHSCPHCNRRFTHNGNLMRHMELHDPNSNAIKTKHVLKAGRSTRINPDGSIIELENCGKRENQSTIEVNKKKSATTIKMNDDFYLKSQDNHDYEQNVEMDSSEEEDEDEDVLQFDIDSESMTLTPIPKKANKPAQSTQEVRTFIINKELDNKEDDFDMDDDSDYIVFDVIDCPEVQSYE